MQTWYTLRLDFTNNDDDDFFIFEFITVSRVVL